MSLLEAVPPVTAAVGVPPAAGHWKWQLRDKEGKWIQMGSEVSFSHAGTTINGVIVGSPKEGYAAVKMPSGEVMTVPTSAITATGRTLGSPTPEQKPGTLGPAKETKPKKKKKVKAVVPALKAVDRARGRGSSAGTSSAGSTGGSTESNGTEIPDDRRLLPSHRLSRSIESQIRIRAKEMGIGDPFESKSDSKSKTGGSKDGGGTAAKGSAGGASKDSSASKSKEPREDTRQKLTQSQITTVHQILVAVAKDVRNKNYGSALQRLGRAKDVLDNTSAPWLNKRIHFLIKGITAVDGGVTAAAGVTTVESFQHAKSKLWWLWQLRDANGQWIEMNSEVKWLAQGRMQTGRIVDSPNPTTVVVQQTGSNARFTLPTSRIESMVKRLSDDPRQLSPGRLLDLQGGDPLLKSSEYMALRTLSMDAIRAFGGSVSGEISSDDRTQYWLMRERALHLLHDSANRQETVTSAVKKLDAARREIASARAFYPERQEKLLALEAMIRRQRDRLRPLPERAPKSKITLKQAMSELMSAFWESPALHSERAAVRQRSLMAAGDSWRWQLRDADGQWIEMGSRVHYLVSGKMHTGKIVGSPREGIAMVLDEKDDTERKLSSADITAIPDVGSKVEYTSGVKTPKRVFGEVVGPAMDAEGRPKKGRVRVRTYRGNEIEVAEVKAKLLPLDETRRAVQEFGGFSAKVDGDVPTSGYMVAQSRGSTEGQITAEQFFGPDGEDYLYDFMVANAKQFDSDPNVYLGIWHDKKNGTVVIDVAHNVQDRDSAVLMAGYQNQISIWDVINQEEIETGGTGGYAEPAVRPPDQEGLGDDGGGTPGVGAPDDQQRPPSRLPPPVGPTRPVVARSSMSTVDPADYATVNNGGGTLVDPVHVYNYEATEESTDKKTGVVTPARPARSLTVRQSDVAKHYRDVVEAAIHRGEKANVKASEEAIAKARLWYQTAQDNARRIQEKYNAKYPEANLSLLEVAGVIAAVSPRQGWDQNLISAEKVIDAYFGRTTSTLDTLKDETGAGLRDNVEMALKILDTHGDSEVMTGLKRKSFWNNLMDPQGNDFDVTIDGWMASAIWRMGGEFSDGTPVDEKALAWIDHTTKRDGVQVIDGAGYIIMADAVRDVARELGLLPHEVQAIYWTAVGGGQTNTQMWSNEPRRTGPLPGYNSKGERALTKWDDDTLWPKFNPDAQRYRYGHFSVVQQSKPRPGKPKGWYVSDPFERTIPYGKSQSKLSIPRWFKTKQEAIDYMNGKYTPGTEPTTMFWRGANGEMFDTAPEGPFEGYVDRRYISPIHPQGIRTRRTGVLMASAASDRLDADGGEWTDPNVYDAVAIEDMAQRFRATDGPVEGIRSAWERSRPHPTAGQITWCWENPDAWALAEVDQEWFSEQIANQTI